jgi:hypothetical protein
MKLTVRFSIFLVVCATVALSAVTASATTSTLKCDPNNDTVWVYGSVTRLEVQVKLSCGQTVEVLDRTDGYVKVRTQHGVEGYIAESAFSDLPPSPVEHDPTQDVGSVAKSVQAKEIAEVAASNAAFVTPDAGSPDASAQVSLANPRINDASPSNAMTGSSMLPNEMAEMNPLKASAPEASAPPSSSSLDAATPASPKPVSLPVSAVVLPTHLDGTPIQDGDDVADSKVESDSQDPACRTYFSAYGLTANQLKWIAQNRKKSFPGVCPAANVSEVNYVIIFTHDVRFFTATLPDPVHYLHGFSDFRSMTPVDNTLVSESEAEKAHREYVWVFHFANGGFNPATFSPHRAVQFTKVETNSVGSKAASKAVEDAFRFLENADH